MTQRSDMPVAGEKPPASDIRGHVVVVDDNPATLYATSRILRAAGYEVVEANNGRKGLDAVGPDTALIILDINMPDIDGYEVSRILRAHPATSTLPILHLSATFVDDMDRVTGYEAGADAYLTHPVEPLVLIATVRAIFRARQAEEATRESEAKLRAIFEQVPTGIALLTEELEFLDANPAMCRLLGRDFHQIQDVESLAGLLSVEESALASIRQQLRDASLWCGSMPCVRPDGTRVELDWHISEFSPGRILALATDVTEQRRAEAEREQLLESERVARAEAERANRLKDEFLATLSHELRNPLQTIVGWSDVLATSAREPALKTGLEAMDRSAVLLTHMIGDLLDVSRITSGKLNFDIGVVNLDAVLDAAVQVVTPSSVAKQIRIERTYSERDPIVLGDASRLQQVAWNLLANAIKFTPKGGKVEVAVERGETHVEFVVSDNGSGIAPEFLPHVFERFSQHGSSQRRAGGLGLGLAIVKHLVEMHGGSVIVRSEGVGRGAQFVVSLPVSPLLSLESPAQPVAEGEPSGYDRAGPRVYDEDEAGR